MEPPKITLPTDNPNAVPDGGLSGVPGSLRTPAKTASFSDGTTVVARVPLD